MPALPWKTISAPDRDREYVVMGTRLPLARYRDLPGFLRATMLIRAQLARGPAPGRRRAAHRRCTVTDRLCVSAGAPRARISRPARGSGPMIR